VNARLIAGLVLLSGACRASPIPEAQRYPAGTPFHAKYRMIDGTRLRMIDSGKGTPVVFIHGIGASMYGWRYALPAVVAAGYRVVAFDKPRVWIFRTSRRTATATPRMRTWSFALLDSLGSRARCWWGIRWVAPSPRRSLSPSPDRVRGMVLIDAAGYDVRWPGVLKIARWPFIGAIATSFRGRWVTGRILRSTFADPSKVTEADVDQYYAPVPEPDFGRALRGVLREFRFDNLGGGRLATVQTPTLILWGRRRSVDFAA